MNDINTNEHYAERAVLGCLLLDNAAWEEIDGLLQASDFIAVQHRHIFCAIGNLISANKAADIITVSQYMGDTPDNQNFITLAELANGIYSVKSIRAYADILKQKSIDRKIMQAAQQAMACVREQKENRLDYAQKCFVEIDQYISTQAVSASEIIGEVLKSIDERQAKKANVTGLPTGFSVFDKITGGLHAGDLVVLAGRPGMGKTMFALNIAEHAAILHKHPILIFSLEMGKPQLIERLLVSISGVNANDVKTGHLNTADWQKITSVLSRFSDTKLFLDDRASITVAEIRSQCRKIKREHGLSLVIVDYITLISGDGENETIRVGKISRDLKLLARDLEVPVIAISQLNRSVEYRKDKAPCMADLRQSGSIEQDADLILFIYKEEGVQSVNLVIAKHRNGDTGTVKLSFSGKNCRFKDWEGFTAGNEMPNMRKTRAFEY